VVVGLGKLGGMDGWENIDGVIEEEMPVLSILLRIPKKFGMLTPLNFRVSRSVSAVSIKIFCLILIRGRGYSS